MCDLVCCRDQEEQEPNAAATGAAKEPRAGSERKPSRKAKSKKEYVPPPGTSNYAFLIVLLEAGHRSVGHRCHSWRRLGGRKRREVYFQARTDGSDGKEWPLRFLRLRQRFARHPAAQGVRRRFAADALLYRMELHDSTDGHRYRPRCVMYV